MIEPKIASHGRSICIPMLQARDGLPEATVAQADALALSRVIKDICKQFAHSGDMMEPLFLDEEIPPMQMDSPLQGLILRRVDPATLTIKSLYPREGSSGDPMPIYASIPVAMRLAELLGREATGAAAPRDRVRIAPGAKTAETDA